MIVEVTDREGMTQQLEAYEGWRLSEIIREHGLPISTQCGGACACTTCHIYVDYAWIDRIVPPTPEEEDMLGKAYAMYDNSRLACQIWFQEDFSGLQVRLAPEPETVP